MSYGYTYIVIQSFENKIDYTKINNIIRLIYTD